MSTASTLFGYSTQIDLGNLAVGIGTSAVAIVTYLVAKRSNDTAAKSVAALKSQKIADFRVQWINNFRDTASQLYKLQYEIALTKSDISKARSLERKKLIEKQRQLFLEVSVLKTRLLMMLKQNSNSENEKQLEKLLNKAVSSELSQALAQRKEILARTRAILREEWVRVKTEVEK